MTRSTAAGLSPLLLGGLLVFAIGSQPDPPWVPGVYDGADADGIAAGVPMGALPPGAPALGGPAPEGRTGPAAATAPRPPTAAPVFRVRPPPAG